MNVTSFNDEFRIDVLPIINLESLLNATPVSMSLVINAKATSSMLKRSLDMFTRDDIISGVVMRQRHVFSSVFPSTTVFRSVLRTPTALDVCKQADLTCYETMGTIPLSNMELDMGSLMSSTLEFPTSTGSQKIDGLMEDREVSASNTARATEDMPRALFTPSQVDFTCCKLTTPPATCAIPNSAQYTDGIMEDCDVSARNTAHAKEETSSQRTCRSGDTICCDLDSEDTDNVSTRRSGDIALSDFETDSFARFLFEKFRTIYDVHHSTYNHRIVKKGVLLIASKVIGQEEPVLSKRKGGVTTFDRIAGMRDGFSGIFNNNGALSKEAKDRLISSEELVLDVLSFNLEVNKFYDTHGIERETVDAFDWV